MSEQLCPVCQGRGMVAPGFYLGAMTMTAGTCSEECRRCKGLGTIVIAQQPRQPFGYLDKAPERVPAGEPHEP
jgi:DnaJ-class molecular chaperone